MKPFSTARSSAFLLLLLGIGSICVGYLQQHVHTDWLNFLDNAIADFYANVGSELLSISITVFVIDQANRRQSQEERKEELKLQMGSEEKPLATEAVRLLRLKGWLSDGTLERANLLKANLFGADLRNAYLVGSCMILANLERSRLDNADLSETELQSANLRKASISEVNFRGANLFKADLAGAIITDSNFIGVNLEEARLEGAWIKNCNLQNTCINKANLNNANLLSDLRGADLSEATMIRARLWMIDLNNGFFIVDSAYPYCPSELFAEHPGGTLLQAKFDETTVLPDGTKWSKTTDMRKFLDPQSHGNSARYTTVIQKVQRIWTAILKVLFH